jgi:hypothetical protein
MGQESGRTLDELGQDYRGWTLRQRLELLAFDARLAGVPQALLEALWEVIDGLQQLPATPLEQFPTALRLRVGRKLDLALD